MPKYIVDTDIGVDDAIAVLMLLKHVPISDIVAFTMVNGNTNLQQCTLNMCRMLHELEIPVHAAPPIFQGAHVPLIQSAIHVHDVHGTDGLGDVPHLGSHTEHKPIHTEHAVNALIRLSREYAGDLVLIAIGPLTNVAMACRMDPHFTKNVSELFIMGGNYRGEGNITSAAEYNFYADPEAAEIVLSTFPTSTVVGWEPVVDHPLSWSWFDSWVDPATGKHSDFVRQITGAVCRFQKAMEEKNGSLGGGFLVPDPMLMAVAINPSIVTKSMKRRVHVELAGTRTRGQLVIDWVSEWATEGEPNVCVVQGIDNAALQQMLLDTVTKPVKYTE